MVNYSLLHACRQILWPTRYNFQHILSLLGDTNCGKTKTIQDLFTFPCGIYYCEGVDIKSNAWTWGSKLNQIVANIWNEKKGINNAANEEIKNFIDIINGQISYQPKNKNEWITKPSHNICVITYNPKQAPFLSDYSVSYEKRYWIIICNQTEQDFKDKFLHTIDENKEQIWAQLYTWVIDNQDCINELNELEVNELKQIQEQNKGITSNEVYEKLNYWLNIKTYISDTIIDIDQVKKFEKNNHEYNGKQLKMIANSAFNDLIKYIGLDSRHKSFIDKNMLSSLGWIKGPKTVDNKSMYVLTKTNIDNPLFLDY